MKHAFILLIIALYSCSMRQEQKSSSVSSDASPHMSGTNADFILTEASTCEQNKLSSQFDVSIDFKRYADTAGMEQSCLLKVLIKDKVTKSIVDTFSVKSSYLYSFMFLSCDSMTSYTTKFKADRAIVDNYFGDLVVVDLNFDGNDDIAVANDCSSNGGPVYSYYLQTGNSRFVKDNFLTDSVVFFPSEIDSKNRTLVTYVHAGACYLGEHIYKLDRNGNSWTEKSHRLINICEEEPRK